MAKEKLRIYLDNCCFNRPFDDQQQVRIKLEAEAKLFIQDKILNKEIDLVWSYILEYENSFNPFEEKRKAIGGWAKHAIVDIIENKRIITLSKTLSRKKIRPKDALHLACAIESRSKYFLTTDDVLLAKTKQLKQIITLNPLEFVTKTE